MRFSNKLSQVLQETKQIFSMQFENMKDNATILETCRRFLGDLSNFYKTGTIPHTTQLFWHRLFLRKRRLDQKNVSLEMTIKKKTNPAGTQRANPAGLFAVAWLPDGKYISANWIETLHIDKTYSQNGRSIGHFSEEGLGSIAIIESLKTTENYICPNCGAAQTQQQLLDGCDYCLTKFHMEDFEKKISSWQFKKNNKKHFKTVMLYMALLVACITIGRYFFAFFGIDNPATKGMVGSSLFQAFSTFVSLAVGLGFLAFWGFLIISIVTVAHDNRENTRKRKFERSIRATDPFFSLNRFYGGLDNKLAAIHFAQSQKDIAALVEPDISACLRDYDDVLDFSIHRVTHWNFALDPQYQLVNVRVIALLTVLRNGKIKYTKERLTVSLKKDRNSKTQEICESHAFRCQNCGSSVSLLDGGICQSCQNTSLKLETYDWVISGYTCSYCTPSM